MKQYNVTSHVVPRIEEFRKFVQFLDGVDSEFLKRLTHQIWEATGTPQEPRDWKRPSQWIPRLHAEGSLDDDTRNLAHRMHTAGFNARHLHHTAASAAVKHGFIDDRSGTYTITDRGREFAHGDRSAVDTYLVENGVIAILEFLYKESGPTMAELLPKWRNWINTKGGRNVKAQSVLEEGVGSRIKNVLIPLGYARKEGIPRRYFIAEKGIYRVEQLRIDEKAGAEEGTRHDIAVESLVDIGSRLGYQTQSSPTLRDMLPPGRQARVSGRVYDKKLDCLWKTNLPLVGEIRIPIEVQAKGSIPELLLRLKIVAPYSHYMIVASDASQIAQIDEYIKAQGDEKIFSDKIIFLTFQEVTDIRSHVTGISSKLKPAYGEEDSLEGETE